MELGSTYLVEVPQDLPPNRYPVNDVHSTESLMAALVAATGTRFALTIVDIDADARLVDRAGRPRRHRDSHPGGPHD